ncbi:MAG TPA: ABC transporter substrate-binding protein [Pseudolabrys sp.]|nr:ABC transporter substrate-binding protein [Pseudolabrys sp.]
MRRREFVRFIGGAAVWPLAARAQPQPSAIESRPARVPVIGILWPGVAAPAAPRMEAFREGLSKSGFVDGRNAAIELRFAQAGLQQLPELAADLVRLKVDVILASGDHAPRVAQQATNTLPIVAFSDDILGAGLISTLSRPGGNMTGLTILSPELSVKRLEVLREIVPGISRVAALWDPTTGKSQVQLTEKAARALDIQVQILEVRDGSDLDKAFLAAQRERAEALNVFSSPFLASLYRDIIELAAQHRLPAIYQWKEHAQAGGLVSYGPGLADLWRQAATIVAKILRGAKPADLPVEQPTRFEFVLNAKTAKSLNLPIPAATLLRADELIE